MLSKKRTIPMIIFVVAGLILAACGGATPSAPAAGGAATAPAAGAATAPPAAGGGAAEGSGVTITYQLWDSNQQPAYQACADKFHEQNPNITVKIEQLGW